MSEPREDPAFEALPDSIEELLGAEREPGRPEFADATFELEHATADQIETVWRTYWVPLISLDGKGRGVNLQALKAELYDAYRLVDNARAVYRAATGGLCDDLTASPAGIIAVLNRRFENIEFDAKARIDAANRRIVTLEQTVAQLRLALREAIHTPREDGDDE